MGRVRIFAGPNGSGKTTLNTELKGKFSLGYYLNADDLCAQVKKAKAIDFSIFALTPSAGELESFFRNHPLYTRLPSGLSFKLVGAQAIFSKLSNMYEIAIFADYLRHSLLETGKTFSFETVFSHPDKISFIEKANRKGYRTYLYFVSTNAPEINAERIKQRVVEGGHNVPRVKIHERYYRSLENLLPAIKQSYRTFIFDNSGRRLELVAEVTPNKELRIEAKRLPIWFEKYVLSKIEEKPISEKS